MPCESQKVRGLNRNSWCLTISQKEESTFYTSFQLVRLQKKDQNNGHWKQIFFFAILSNQMPRHSDINWIECSCHNLNLRGNWEKIWCCNSRKIYQTFLCASEYKGCFSWREKEYKRCSQHLCTTFGSYQRWQLFTSKVKIE